MKFMDSVRHTHARYEWILQLVAVALLGALFAWANTQWVPTELYEKQRKEDLHQAKILRESDRAENDFRFQRIQVREDITREQIHEVKLSLARMEAHLVAIKQELERQPGR